MDGLDILGADTIDMTSPQFQAVYQQMRADVAAQKAQPIVFDPRTQRAWNAATYTVAGSAIGSVVGGVGLAALWASHRVLGFLLGFLIAGPAAGASIGYAIGQAKAVK